jgi:hypothetical protein
MYVQHSSVLACACRHTSTAEQYSLVTESPALLCVLLRFTLLRLQYWYRMHIVSYRHAIRQICAVPRMSRFLSLSGMSPVLYGSVFPSHPVTKLLLAYSQRSLEILIHYRAHSARVT